MKTMANPRARQKSDPSALIAAAAAAAVEIVFNFRYLTNGDTSAVAEPEQASRTLTICLSQLGGVRVCEVLSTISLYVRRVVVVYDVTPKHPHSQQPNNPATHQATAHHCSSALTL